MKILPMLPEAQEQLDQILGSDVPLGILTDVISYMLDIDVADKEALLAECNVHRRTELLLSHLAGRPPIGNRARAGWPISPRIQPQLKAPPLSLRERPLTWCPRVRAGHR